MTGICYGHGCCCVARGKDCMILRFGLSTVLGTPFALWKFLLLAFNGTDGFASATDDVAFPGGKRRHLRVIFSMRACLDERGNLQATRRRCRTLTTSNNSTTLSQHPKKKRDNVVYWKEPKGRSILISKEEKERVKGSG